MDSLFQRSVPHFFCWMGTARSIISSVKSLLNPIQKSRGIQKIGGFLILAFVLAQLKSSDVTSSTLPSWLKPREGVAWPSICIIGASVRPFKSFAWKQSQTRPSNQHGLFIIFLINLLISRVTEWLGCKCFTNFVLETFFLQIGIMGNIFESCWSRQISAEFPDSFMKVLKLLFQICIWHFRQVVLELIVLVHFFLQIIVRNRSFFMQILHRVVLENLFWKLWLVTTWCN